MYSVYILRSQKDTEKIYIGITTDLRRRILEHNQAPSCSYTKKYGPWKLTSYIFMTDKGRAFLLEAYLKSHSGHAFLKKHFL